MIIKVRNYGFIALTIILTGLGASLMMKADLGIGAYDGIAKSIALLLDVKVGSVSMSLNITFFVLQLVMLRSKTPFNRLLQLPIVIVLGFSINYFTYEVLEQIVINLYLSKLALFFIGLLLVAFSCALLLNLQIGYPLEGFCQLVSEKYKFIFFRVRQGVDVISIIAIVLLFILKDIPIPIREGTILSLIVFGPLVQWFMKVTPIKNK